MSVEIKTKFTPADKVYALFFSKCHGFSTCINIVLTLTDVTLVVFGLLAEQTGVAMCKT